MVVYHIHYTYLTKIVECINLSFVLILSCIINTNIGFIVKIFVNQPQLSELRVKMILTFFPTVICHVKVKLMKHG